MGQCPVGFKKVQNPLSRRDVNLSTSLYIPNDLDNAVAPDRLSNAFLCEKPGILQQTNSGNEKM